ncbi:hypothetical protein [Terasakiella pusilla]
MEIKNKSFLKEIFYPCFCSDSLEFQGAVGGFLKKSCAGVRSLKYNAY